MAGAEERPAPPAAVGGVASADRASGTVAVTAGCGWSPGPGSAPPGEQAATHTTINAAAMTGSVRLLTVSGS